VPGVLGAAVKTRTLLTVWITFIVGSALWWYAGECAARASQLNWNIHHHHNIEGSMK